MSTSFSVHHASTRPPSIDVSDSCDFDGLVSSSPRGAAKHDDVVGCQLGGGKNEGLGHW